MSEQLALVTVPTTPPLTPRQAAAFAYLCAAGRDGLHTDEVGAFAHEMRGKHSRETRCLYCGRDGDQMLRALRRKGYARYKRAAALQPGYWLAVGTLAERESTMSTGTWAEEVPHDGRASACGADSSSRSASVPYNQFPENY